MDKERKARKVIDAEAAMEVVKLYRSGYMTQKQLSQRLGVSEKTICEFLSGKTSVGRLAQEVYERDQAIKLLKAG